MTDGDDVFPVQLWQYDLTQGMARVLSPMLLGEMVEGVWHTSLVVHGVEYLFGYGVQRAVPGTTPFGQPLHKIDLGVTQVTKDLVEDLVNDLGAESFAPESYNLIQNNCNHFTQALSLVLVGQGIPAHILTQHEVLLRSPMGQQLMPMLSQRQSSAAASQLLRTLLSAATIQMEGQLGRTTAAGQAPAGAPPAPGQS